MPLETRLWLSALSEPFLQVRVQVEPDGESDMCAYIRGRPEYIPYVSYSSHFCRVNRGKPRTPAVRSVKSSSTAKTPGVAFEPAQGVITT